VTFSTSYFLISSASNKKEVSAASIRPFYGSFVKLYDSANLSFLINRFLIYRQYDTSCSKGVNFVTILKVCCVTEHVFVNQQPLMAVQGTTPMAPRDEGEKEIRTQSFITTFLVTKTGHGT
jgi:hypothetical protein